MGLTMSDAPDESKLETAKRIMSALVKQPPKPHEDMRVGKEKSPANKVGLGAHLKRKVVGKRDG